jgi:hypothetical protein
MPKARKAFVSLFSLFFFSFLISNVPNFSARLVRLTYQPPVSSTLLSEQTNHQQPVNSTFHSEQISTSHQPTAKRTGC